MEEDSVADVAGGKKARLGRSKEANREGNTQKQKNPPIILKLPNLLQENGKLKKQSQFFFSQELAIDKKLSPFLQTLNEWSQISALAAVHKNLRQIVSSQSVRHRPLFPQLNWQSFVPTTGFCQGIYDQQRNACKEMEETVEGDTKHK